jgi:hypothetical protein
MTGGKVRRILNDCNRRRFVFSFSLRPLEPWGRSPRIDVEDLTWLTSCSRVHAEKILWIPLGQILLIYNICFNMMLNSMNADSKIFLLLKFHNHNFVRIYFILHPSYVSPYLVLFSFYCNCDAMYRQHCPGLSIVSIPSEVKRILA